MNIELKYAKYSIDERLATGLKDNIDQLRYCIEYYDNFGKMHLIQMNSIDSLRSVGRK